MYPKSIRTTTVHIHRGGRGEDGAHYIGGGGGGVFLLVYRLVESIYLLCLAVSRLKGV